MSKEKINNEEFTNFVKSKGFIYQGCEIYGGLSGIYDYGHTGTALKHNWSNLWKKFFLKLGDNFVEIDASIIMHENVFKASGHIDNFYDPIAKCSKCSNTERADKLIEEKLNQRVEGLSSEELFKIIKDNNLVCPKCKSSFANVEILNLMFPVTMGPTKGIKAYLRPESAQGPYLNFKIQYEIMRKKMPMGLAMIGKAYRNEISPRNLVLRTRELEQAELQIFFNPEKVNEHEKYAEVKNYKLRVVLKDDRKKDTQEKTCDDLLAYGIPKFYLYHMAKVQQFYFDVIGLDKNNFRFLELFGKEKAFYNKYHFDIEVKMNNPNSWVEIAGVHYRTDHDLKGHQKISGVNLEVLDEETKKKYLPHVLELSFGLGRNVYTLLDQQLIDEQETRGNNVLKFPNKLAPYKVAVFPLMNKPQLVKLAREIYSDLLEEEIDCIYDKSGSIGKRYSRQDEIGTPYCLTIDYEAIEDGDDKGTVTIRDRDSMEQKRIKIEEVAEIISKLVKGRVKFDEI